MSDDRTDAPSGDEGKPADGKPAKGKPSRSSRVAHCSFCGKSHREVGPLIEGPEGIFICASCVDLCESIIQQERRRAGTQPAHIAKVPPPREIHDFLNLYIVGQERAKRTLSVAVHNHYKRLHHAQKNQDVESPSLRCLFPT